MGQDDTLATRPRCEDRYVQRIKPLIDRALALALILLLLPVSAAVGVAVRVRLGGPVFYRQTRVGLRGRQFRLVKFRSMTLDRRSRAEPALGQERRLSYEATDDPRHTPLGAWLRAWSLDELPQLWNVLRGDMSLVGPRPEVPAVVASYEPWQHERHLVRPGLTGLWQVTARTTKPMHANVAIDVDYVRRVSFALDAWILLRTLPSVLSVARAAARTRSSPAEADHGASP